MKDSKIYLDQDGYNEYLSEIKELKEKIKNINKELSKAFTNSAGDGAHDNFEFEEALRQQRLLVGQLNSKNNNLKNIVIVEKQNNQDLIEIGDVVKLNLTYLKDEVEEIIVKLIGGKSKADSNDIVEVSLNSPLGSAIYKRKVNDKTSYTVNNNIVGVEILKKICENYLKKDKQDISLK